MRDDVVATARGPFGVRQAGDPEAPLVLCVHLERPEAAHAEIAAWFARC